MTQVYETRSRKLSPPKAKSHSHIHNVHSHRIMEVWKRCTAVCFDVDSTVCQDEAIDRLAEHCGVGPEVKAWTAKAMGGAIGCVSHLQLGRCTSILDSSFDTHTRAQCTHRALPAS